MTEKPEILTDGGWRSLDFSDPRCPYCGAEAIITETDRYADEELSESRRADVAAGLFEYGWVAVYCSADPDHLDATFDYRRERSEA